MAQILISDPTLRDGNHAVQHRLESEQVRRYAAAANAAGVPIVEVGHGNGLGASSLQVGEALLSDREMLRIAREQLTTSKLGAFGIPGFATRHRDLDVALEEGADVFRVGTHCTEADLTERHITYLVEQGKPVFGVLMMCHMCSPERLAEEARKMQAYGALGVIVMDSAGALLIDDVRRRVAALVEGTHLQVGYHGHDAADLAERELVQTIPTTDSITIVSGLAGVFSGYSKHVRRIAGEFGVDPRDVFFRLGEREVIAGQEDVILEVAAELQAGMEIHVEVEVQQVEVQLQIQEGVA
jgi:4-hydroxy 2-oxovalerate aldolase